MFTFDKMTLDSTGAFLNNELEVLDQTLHMPLTSVTWHRDIQLRTDVTFADDMSSFTNSSFATAGGIGGNGKGWAGKRTNAIAGIELDIEKTAQNLHIWAKEVDWTVAELESAIKLGRPVDTQKVTALNLSYNMDLDNLVYLGDSDIGVTGLANSSRVSNVQNASAANWGTATPAEILASVRELEEAVWKESAYAFAPTKLLLDPVSYAALLQPLTIGGVAFQSILQYIKQNSLCLAVNGKELDIQPVKWLISAGVAGAKRMVAYTPDYDKVRIPATPLAHTPIEFRSLYQITTYYSKLGGTEIVYPSTVGYRDHA